MTAETALILSTGGCYDIQSRGQVRVKGVGMIETFTISLDPMKRNSAISQQQC
jgi:hypothetical protein